MVQCQSACNSGNLGFIPGLERSPGEGKVYPLQYSGLENSRDCIVDEVANSQTQLSDLHFNGFGKCVGASLPNHWAGCRQL